MPLRRIDPLVRLLLVAIVLASVLPVGERWRLAAQGVSNGAVFLLFLLNGLRLPRAEVMRGIGNVRFLLPLVAWCFGAMALAGWALSHLVAGWLLTWSSRLFTSRQLVQLAKCFIPPRMQIATSSGKI